MGSCPMPLVCLYGAPSLRVDSERDWHSTPDVVDDAALERRSEALLDAQTTSRAGVEVKGQLCQVYVEWQCPNHPSRHSLLFNWRLVRPLQVYIICPGNGTRCPLRTSIPRSRRRACGQSTSACMCAPSQPAASAWPSTLYALQALLSRPPVRQRWPRGRRQSRSSNAAGRGGIKAHYTCAVAAREEWGSWTWREKETRSRA